MFALFKSYISTMEVYLNNVQKTILANMFEATSYYPYGLTMAGISSQAAGRPENRFKYNGKEMQHQEFSDGSGLEAYDFGARMQDPQLGVWHNLDPRADAARQWSPYAYALDNPIRIIVPDGMWVPGWYDQMSDLDFHMGDEKRHEHENDDPLGKLASRYMAGDAADGSGPGRGSGPNGVSGAPAPMKTIDGQLAAIINGQPVPAEELTPLEINPRRNDVDKLSVVKIPPNTPIAKSGYQMMEYIGESGNGTDALGSPYDPNKITLYVYPDDMYAIDIAHGYGDRIPDPEDRDPGLLAWPF